MHSAQDASQKIPEFKQIPVEQMEVGAWYVGRGRNANIGMWNGEVFLVLARCGRKVGPGSRDWETYWGVKQEPYFEPDTGCFQPFMRVDMGAVSVPYGERDYALAMTFGQ